MGKEIKHDEVRGIVTDLERLLKRLTIRADDSHDFEDILNKAMQSLYLAQPNGRMRYGDEPVVRLKTKIGSVWLCRFNNEQGNGNTNIEYTPSAHYQEKWKYDQRVIGTINLRERTYSPNWNEKYDENYHQIPAVLMKDTEKVMECLGLTRKQEK